MYIDQSASELRLHVVGGRLDLSQFTVDSVKLDTFECGNEASGSAWGRFSVKFYLTAILFIVFDVEVVFLYPWAVVFRDLGWQGFAAMGIFLAMLVLGLLYEWRKGALEWIEHRRVAHPSV